MKKIKQQLKSLKDVKLSGMSSYFEKMPIHIKNNINNIIYKTRHVEVYIDVETVDWIGLNTYYLTIKPFIFSVDGKKQIIYMFFSSEYFIERQIIRKMFLNDKNYLQRNIKLMQKHAINCLTYTNKSADFFGSKVFLNYLLKYKNIKIKLRNKIDEQFKLLLAHLEGTCCNNKNKDYLDDYNSKVELFYPFNYKVIDSTK